MQEKVDILISMVQNLIGQLDRLGVNELSRPLSDACFCLKSHDLIGLKIILTSIEKESLFKEIEDLDFHKIISQIIELATEIQQTFNKDIVPLSVAEELFLNLGYNKFFDICSEVYTQEFWEQSPNYRLSKIHQAFSIYSELLNHEPFKGVLSWLSKYRPPMESEISGPLFKFIRNVFAHFPFYDTWDEIWISKDLVNWRYPNQSIDKFLMKFTGKPVVEYRFKEKSKTGFTYVTINFPKTYDNEKIFLKDMIKEEEGVKFALVMMIRVLNTQIESIKEY
ncbi:MAG: hypothetical protein U0V04_17220 [Spirosomataceae bacterium]|jgi:hypothetical protein